MPQDLLGWRRRVTVDGLFPAVARRLVAPADLARTVHSGQLHVSVRFTLM
jgi:hypothetical protein